MIFLLLPCVINKHCQPVQFRRFNTHSTSGLDTLVYNSIFRKNTNQICRVISLPFLAYKFHKNLFKKPRYKPNYQSQKIYKQKVIYPACQFWYSRQFLFSLLAPFLSFSSQPVLTGWCIGEHLFWIFCRWTWAWTFFIISKKIFSILSDIKWKETKSWMVSLHMNKPFLLYWKMTHFSH